MQHQPWSCPAGCRLLWQQHCLLKPSPKQDAAALGAPALQPSPSPLFWSKNSSVKMGTSKVEKVSLHSPAWGTGRYRSGRAEPTDGDPVSLGLGRKEAQGQGKGWPCLGRQGRWAEDGYVLPPATPGPASMGSWCLEAQPESPSALTCSQPGSHGPNPVVPRASVSPHTARPAGALPCAGAHSAECSLPQSPRPLERRKEVTL